MKLNNILVAIVNHALNTQAIKLKEQFSQHCETILIDSGSKIKEEEASQFDYLLPNVYYSGLLNKAFEHFNSSSKKVVLVITSDVTIPDSQLLLTYISDAFSHPKTGVYAPSANDSNHHQMKYDGSNKLKRVTFTEGFCFGASKEILSEMCPIDTNSNHLGHGLDIYLGYLAMKHHKYSYVDHRITVNHPLGSGYDGDQAEKQRFSWFATLNKRAQRFHRLVLNTTYQTNWGYWYIWWLTKGRS